VQIMVLALAGHILLTVSMRIKFHGVENFVDFVV